LIGKNPRPFKLLVIIPRQIALKNEMSINNIQ